MKSLIIIPKISFLLCFVFVSSCNKKEDLKTYKKPSVITAETIAMRGLEPSYLTKSDAIIEQVYKINKDGDTHFFEMGIDYISLKNGGIKRTSFSQIPDFSSHLVILTSNGKFDWRSEPNRNPQLSIPYQVMVDYQTLIDSEVVAKGGFLSTKLRKKLNNGENIKMICIGTSISAGAHTLPQYYDGKDLAAYPHLIGKAIENLYSVETSIENLSIGGATASSFLSRVEYIISQKPDVIFVEFGMNGHRTESDLKKNIESIKVSVERLSAAGIDCIVVSSPKNSTV